MNRIGLIRKLDGCWIFSSVFRMTLKNLATTKLEAFQIPAQVDQEVIRERLYVEMAKGFKG
ncbi:hypothetical protein KA005_47705 [bacterium]|nr:hypothetical protein [bacterium]